MTPLPAPALRPAVPADPPAAGESTPPAHFPSEQQQRIWYAALTGVATIVLLGVIALLFLGFITFLSWSYAILLPLGLSVIVALTLNPIVDFLVRRKVPRGIATLLTAVIAIILFVFFWSYLGATLWDQAGDVFYRLEDALKVQDSATVWMNQHVPDWVRKLAPDWQQQLPKNASSLLYQGLAPVGQAFGFLLGFAFVPIYVYYFLAEKDQISTRWRDFVPIPRSPLRDEVVEVLEQVQRSVFGYLRGQIIVAGVNGFFTIIGLSVIGIPNSLVLGVLAGVLSIVPFLGIIISILPALLFAFISAQDATAQWLKPVGVLGVFVAVQMIESMFVTPRVQSHSTGLHPVVIILGILFWSLVLPGLLGPIVAVPLTCAVMVMLRRYAWPTEPEPTPPTKELAAAPINQ